MNARLAVLGAALVGVSALKILDTKHEEPAPAVVEAAQQSVRALSVATAKDDAKATSIAKKLHRPLPWPVAMDPFQADSVTPHIAPTAPLPTLVASPTVSPFPRSAIQNPVPMPAKPMQASTPRLTVFGIWQDDKQAKVMLATPSGVMVAGVGEQVLNLRLESIDKSSVTLVDRTSGNRVVLNSPRLAVAPPPTVGGAMGQ